MAIEDLPIIKEKNIRQKSPIVDIAEISTRMPLPPMNGFFGIASLSGMRSEIPKKAVHKELFYVLGRGKHRYTYAFNCAPTELKDGVFVATALCWYGLVRLDCYNVNVQPQLSYKHIPLEEIKTYTSLVPEKKS